MSSTPNHLHDGTRLLLSPRDAANALSLSERKLWELKKTSAIPSSKIGTRTVFPVAGLNAWIAAGCPTEPGAADLLNWRDN